VIEFDSEQQYKRSANRPGDFVMPVATIHEQKISLSGSLRESGYPGTGMTADEAAR
jgi:hypothetical protein